VVALSGGRDSAAVLAVAAAVARREGLDQPAAVSLAFPGRYGDESEWQELAVRAAGIEDWERIEIREELDLVGPLATSVLRRHGLLFPAHAHLYAPILERAHGGTVLTGIGGDNAAEGWRFQRLAEALRGRRRPTVEDVRSALLWAAPRPLRRAALARGSGAAPPWLTDAAKRAHLAARAEAEAAWPRRWPDAVAMATGGRRLALAQAGLARLAAGAGADIVHPLLDGAWLSELADVAPPLGFGGRERLWPRLFADVLPVPLLRRREKAVYDGVYFTGPSRRFAAEWDGGGLTGAMVDADRLRATWRDPWRGHHPAVLQQALWLSRAA
jgi:asparagine synthase (glutamine-hydrolysing)